MKKPILISLTLLGVAISAFALMKYIQLGGQSPTWFRVFRTETGGRPTYEPIQYREKDNRPAIMKPEFVAAADATMAAGTMGMAVTVGVDARFYPLHILAYHQIVNDTCGGKKIACTY